MARETREDSMILSYDQDVVQNRGMSKPATSFVINGLRESFQMLIGETVVEMK